MLISNYTNIDKIKRYFDVPLYHMSDIKFDLLEHGKEYCIEKYGDNIQSIESISLFQETKVINIFCKSDNNIDEISKNFFENDVSIYENNDMLKTFSAILSTIHNLRHKIISDQDLEEYNIYKTTEHYSVLHIMNQISFKELYETIDFNIEEKKNFHNIFYIFLYNYNDIIVSNITNIFDENLEELKTIFDITPKIFDI